MALSADSVLSDLKQGKFAPVYFLQGEEPYYIDLISNYIEEYAIDDTAKGFNQVILYGKDIAVRDLLTQARRFPMMSERQTVIVKEAQDISDLSKEEGQNYLEEYLNQPLESTILVLGHKHKSIDKRKKLWKVLAKKAVIVDSKKLYDNQIADWTKKYIVQRGHTIEDKAAHMLSENIGNNLQRITNEIEKILINFKDKVSITPQLVHQYVGINKDYNSFELQRAVAKKDILRANQIVNYFGENPKGNPVLPIIAILFSFFSKLLILHQSPDKSDGVLAAKLKVSPYFVKEYVSAGSHYSLAKVINNIHHLRNADLSIKGVTTISLSEKELLRELLFKLMH